MGVGHTGLDVGGLMEREFSENGTVVGLFPNRRKTRPERAAKWYSPPQSCIAVELYSLTTVPTGSAIPRAVHSRGQALA